MFLIIPLNFLEIKKIRRSSAVNVGRANSARPTTTLKEREKDRGKSKMAKKKKKKRETAGKTSLLMLTTCGSALHAVIFAFCFPPVIVIVILLCYEILKF